MYFINTADVELTSISENKPTNVMGELVLRKGLPRLLETYSKFDVQGTFFFTGDIVEKYPEVIDLVKSTDNEIGCHGYTHYSTTGFDTMDIDEQISQLKLSKSIIEKQAGKIVSFRSPELRINKDTVKALEATNFQIDSSVSSQRFDGPLSYGTKNKLSWMSAERKPYMMSHSNPFQAGNSSILEVPVSALLAPYINTTLRINPTIFRFTEKVIMKESLRTNKPVVFLTHPNECIFQKQSEKVWSSKSLLSSFRDKFRTRLKLKNLGIKNIRLIEETLKLAKSKGFEFVSMKKYKKHYNESNF